MMVRTYVTMDMRRIRAVMEALRRQEITLKNRTRISETVCPILMLSPKTRLGLSD
jgi:hypothetical protein